MGGDRLRDRVLARALGGARQPKQSSLARRRPRRARATRMRPSVTVPVLSSTIVVIRRVCSSTSGPLISTPSCAPRPVPTSSAVGVARPSAHGQAMISTATAAVNASAGVAGDDQPAGERQQRDADHDGHEDGRHAVDEPLDRRLAGLRLGDEPRDLRERRVRADAGGADDEPPERVDRAAGDVVAGPDLDGHRLAGQHRLVDRGGAVDDDAVGGDLLTGTNDEQVVRRAAPRSGRAPPRRRAARARPSRRARAARESPRPSAAGRASSRYRPSRIRVVTTAATSKYVCAPTPATSTDGRPGERRQRPERDQRVHRRGAVAGVRDRGAVERPARPEHDRRRERERDPLPAVELQRRDHRQRSDRRRERGRHHEREHPGARCSPPAPRPGGPRRSRPPRRPRRAPPASPGAGSKSTVAASVA